MDVTYFLHISFIYSYSSPFTLSRVTKNNLYIIYMDVTYSLHISFTYSYISKSQKQPTFIYLDITYFLNTYILHISYHSHINILIFPPFSFRGTKKRPILTSHIFSLCFSHFLSYINFPSLLVQLYKRQPIYGGHIFLHPSHILLSHVSKFSPSLLSGSESKKTVPCLWCTLEQPVPCQNKITLKTLFPKQLDGKELYCDPVALVYSWLKWGALLR